jgi:hypothetical protein
MNPFNLPAGDDRLREFDRLLKEDVSVERCDFDSMEKQLFERIQKADQLGPLAQLKVEQTPPVAFWDKLESDLFARIQNHREYEVPIDEVIAGPEDLPAQQWQRLESKLEEKMRSVAQLEPWEQHLKAEITLSPGRWERMEDKLLARIERQRKLEDLATHPFWLGLGFYLSRPLAKTSAVMALTMALALGAYRIYQNRFQPIETLVYQAQGDSVQGLDSSLQFGRTAFLGQTKIQAKENGSLILVNKRGFIEMHNGSGLEVEKAKKGNVRYRVAFSGRKSDSKGNLTFFVNHRQAQEKFEVATPDYRIDVVGTFFRVDPDLGGHVSTTVLEGKVKIHSNEFGDFDVEAGQSLVYDETNRHYSVLSGGRSIRREDIETVPNIDDLKSYGVVTVTSNVMDAEVRIDGKYRGVTPLVLLLPPGRHPLQLSKEGHAVLDTSVTVGNGDFHRVAGLLQDLTPGKVVVEAPVVKAITPVAKTTKAKTESSATPAVSRKVEAELIYNRADQVQVSNWQLAINLYYRVLEHPLSGELHKEAALFSIARLRAEHENDKEPSKEDFLKYLALYPDGAFAGESWMRLAELEVGKNQDKAIEYYLRCIEKFPRHPRLSELQHRVGLLYLQNQKYDLAVSMFKQSLANVLYSRESEKKKIYGSLYRTLVAKGDLKGAQLIDPVYRPTQESGEPSTVKPAPLGTSAKPSNPKTNGATR